MTFSTNKDKFQHYSYTDISLHHLFRAVCKCTENSMKTEQNIDSMHYARYNLLGWKHVHILSTCVAYLVTNAMKNKDVVYTQSGSKSRKCSPKWNIILRFLQIIDLSVRSAHCPILKTTIARYGIKITRDGQEMLFPYTSNQRPIFQTLPCSHAGWFLI